MRNMIETNRMCIPWDYEYERKGTRNLFVMVEPQRTDH